MTLGDVCVGSGGFSRSLAEGMPHPALVQAVRDAASALTPEDLVSLDALDLNQPLGTLLDNAAFAKLFYTARDATASCPSTQPRSLLTRTTPLADTPPAPCPTADDIRATEQQLTSGAPTSDVRGTLAASAAACETAVREGRPLPSVDGTPPAPPVPLATLAESFRKAADVLDAQKPGSGRPLAETAALFVRMQAESVTAGGKVNALLRPLGDSFESAGGPGGRFQIEVRGQVDVGAAERAGLGVSPLRYARDLAACIGLGGRMSTVMDLTVASARAAACDVGCVVATQASRTTRSACATRGVTTCAPVLTDPSHCGQCGRACGQGERCVGGTCKGSGNSPTPNAIKNGTFDGTLAPWEVVKVKNGVATIIATPPSSCPAGRDGNPFAALDVSPPAAATTVDLYLQQSFVVPADATNLEVTAWNAFQAVELTISVVSAGVEKALETFVPVGVYASVPVGDAPLTCSGAGAVTKRYSLAAFTGTEATLRLRAKGNDRDDLATLCLDDVRMTN